MDPTGKADMDTPRPEATPLTDTEKAYFDTIRQVATSPRPGDLRLQRAMLDGRDVAVVMQRVISSSTAETLGFQPLAILVDDDTAARLRNAHGEPPQTVSPDGAEGAG